MKIDTLNISNFKSIEKSALHFDGKSAVLFGINGSGKTSILRTITLVYSNIINRIVRGRYKQGMNIELEDIRIGAEECAIELGLSFLGEQYRYGRKMVKKASQMRKHINNDDLETLSKHFESLFDDTIENSMNIPLFASYGVNRLVIDIPLRIRKTHVFEPLYAYENAIRSTVDFRTFFEWFRNREDYEGEIMRENRNYEDPQLKAVRTATGMMLDGFTGLCVKRNPLAMKIKKDGMLFDVRQLSDGEKCTLALFGDLARRIAMANPTLDDPLQGEGVVLIDEVELHLHPQWQRKIVPTLRKVFSNVQFIVSTHSPQVLSDISDDMKVFMLVQENNHIRISGMESLNGWDINSILENHMHTSSQFIGTKKLIQQAYDLVEEGEYEKATELTNQLQHKTSGANQVVVDLRFLINRGMRKREKNQ